nr:RecName: Full=Acidic lectin A3 [Psophocarpus scandens]
TETQSFNFNVFEPEN